MDTTISKLLGEGGLPAELVASLQEAFDKKVAEAHEQAEASVREEFASRYEHDKSNLVEAMDRMLTDVVQKHAAEKQAAVQKFVEARTAFRRAVKENRAKSAATLNENLARSRAVVTESLKREVVKLREQKQALTKARLETAGKLEAIKESLARTTAERFVKIDRFVTQQVTRELKEFSEDHRALVETRVKLVREGRKKLRETQARFVKEAAKNVEQVITEALVREMKQLHEDLERNRQNMFGRRIFEAVAAEFMTSYLAEGTEIRKLQNEVASKDGALAEATKKLDEALTVGQQAARKARLAEDRAVRSKVMGELLSNLRGERRTVMEGMLETVKTDALRTTFNKLLPVVLDETARKPTTAAKKPLVESTRAKPAATVVTGDNRTAARLFESNKADAEMDSAIAQVVRLAGISK